MCPNLEPNKLLNGPVQCINFQYTLFLHLELRESLSAKLIRLIIFLIVCDASKEFDPHITSVGSPTRPTCLFRNAGGRGCAGASLHTKAPALVSDTLTFEPGSDSAKTRTISTHPSHTHL